MAVCVVRRIDEAYRDDDQAAVPVLELMGGPANLEDLVRTDEECKVCRESFMFSFYIHASCR